MGGDGSNPLQNAFKIFPYFFTNYMYNVRLTVVVNEIVVNISIDQTFDAIL